ncbi:MAG: Peptide deformylase [Microgenomates group bacterium GW2011_GWA2_46_7]|nr:MAG: Peptide deformylase [Microgenomates group bacterium GW2011_GWA2_46_7]
MKIKLVKTKKLEDVPKILREKSKEVEKITPQILDLIEKMKKIMKENNGVGISAVQVGRLLRIMIIKVGDKDMAFINPVITRLGKEIVPYREGCLSFPGYYIHIKRPQDVILEATTEDSKEVEVKTDALPARAIQHEIDHMNGIVFRDHAKNQDDIENHVKRLLQNIRGR